MPSSIADNEFPVRKWSFASDHWSQVSACACVSINNISVFKFIDTKDTGVQYLRLH